MSSIPLARPSIGEADLAAHARVLRSGRLVLGPENQAFEAAVAQRAGRPYAVAVASGTMALHLALRSLGLRPGGEVLVPAFTFPAPAHAAANLGLTPVAIDVDEDTWNLSPAAVAHRLSRRIVAIIAVDQFGLLADHGALVALATDAGVPLVEDAACAIGAADATGRPGGSAGAVACFSFHPRKIVTTGEGGAVVTSDDETAARLRRLRNHGQARAGEFVEAGENGRLPETAAAMGRTQLERLDGWITERRRLVDRYVERLTAGPRGARLRFQQPPPGFRHSWQTFAVVLPPGVERTRVVAGLRDRGVESGPATYALHRIGSFAGRPGFDARSLPVADRLHDRALALPLFAGMTAAQVERVTAALEEVLP